MPDRIPYSRLADYRARTLIEQSNLCPLCGGFLDYEHAVVDHCHRTGIVRAVIHRSCNSVLGKIENNHFRFGMSLEQLKGFAPNIFGYLYRTDYSDHPCHPKHKIKE